MDFCPKCGFSFKEELVVEDREDLNFCPRCGKKLDGFRAADESPENLDGRILDLLQKNLYLEAIRLVREKTNQGLKECKDAVDDIARKNGMIPEEIMTTPKKRFRLFLIVAAFFGLVIASAGIAVFPKLGLVARPFLCDGKLQIRSSKLYTPPGQAGYTTGVSRSFHCPDGSDQTLYVFLIATACYTVILLVLLYLRRLYKKIRGPQIRQPKPPAMAP